MSSAILDWVSERLKEDERVIVPVKELWKEWQMRDSAISFDRFACAVLQDQRFEQVYSIDHDSRLEGSGYFSGPRIKLRSREVTEQCLLRLIRSHNERIVEALFRAWEVLREDPASNRHGELREAIQMLAELRPVFSSWTHLKPRTGATGLRKKRPA